MSLLSRLKLRCWIFTVPCLYFWCTFVPWRDVQPAILLSEIMHHRRQVTFVALNRFCPLSKTPTSGWVKESWMKHQAKLNEKCTLFLYCISSFIDTSYEKLQDTAIFLFFVFSHQLLHQQMSFLRFFRISFSIMLERFRH